MAYVAPFLKLSFLFDIVDTREKAQFSLALSPDTTSGCTVADLEPYMNYSNSAAVATAGLVDTFMKTAGLAWQQYSRLYGIKLAMIGTDGYYAGEPVSQALALPKVGGQAQRPPEDAACVTLWSGGTLGHGNLGRVYLPHCGLVMEAGKPRATAAHAQSVAQAAGAFLVAVEDQFEAIPSPTRAVSVLIPSQTREGGHAPVLKVRCGRVNDTQRRRRRSLDEEPFVFTLVR